MHPRDLPGPTAGDPYPGPVVCCRTNVTRCRFRRVSSPSRSTPNGRHTRHASSSARWRPARATQSQPGSACGARPAAKLHQPRHHFAMVGAAGDADDHRAFTLSFFFGGGPPTKGGPRARTRVGVGPRGNTNHFCLFFRRFFFLFFSFLCHITPPPPCFFFLLLAPHYFPPPPCPPPLGQVRRGACPNLFPLYGGFPR